MTLKFTEKYLSQILVLQEHIMFGYNYLSPSRSFAMRNGKTSNVLLVGVLGVQFGEKNVSPAS